MKNYETGAVTCDRCGEYLGNYLNDDYYKLIKLKYCPRCKISADNERKRLWKRERNLKEKQEKKDLKTTNQKLKEENEKLRQQIAELRSRLGEYHE